MAPTPSEVGRGSIISREGITTREIGRARQDIERFFALFGKRAAELNGSTGCSDWKVVGFVFDPDERCLHPVFGTFRTGENFLILGGQGFGRYFYASKEENRLKVKWDGKKGEQIYFFKDTKDFSSYVCRGKGVFEGFSKLSESSRWVEEANARGCNGFFLSSPFLEQNISFHSRRTTSVYFGDELIFTRDAFNKACGITDFKVSWGGIISSWLGKRN